MRGLTAPGKAPAAAQRLLDVPRQNVPFRSSLPAASPSFARPAYHTLDEACSSRGRYAGHSRAFGSPWYAQPSTHVFSCFQVFCSL